MTNKDQNVDAVKESEGSIGFLRASEKMHISTFEIPLVFLEDLGFSKEKIGAAKDFNRSFIGGFYSKMRPIGNKLSFKKSPADNPAQAKPAPQKPKAVKKATPPKAEAVKKAEPAKAAAAAKTSASKAAPANVTH